MSTVDLSVHRLQEESVRQFQSRRWQWGKGAQTQWRRSPKQGAGNTLFMKPENLETRGSRHWMEQLGGFFLRGMAGSRRTRQMLPLNIEHGGLLSPAPGCQRSVPSLRSALPLHQSLTKRIGGGRSWERLGLNSCLYELISA